MNWRQIYYYYYDYSLVLQVQTDLHFKYVTELTKYILTKVVSLVGACQVVVAVAGPLRESSPYAHFRLIGCTLFHQKLHLTRAEYLFFTVCVFVWMYLSRCNLDIQRLNLIVYIFSTPFEQPRQCELFHTFLRNTTNSTYFRLCFTIAL